jgi:transcriptional regulator with XRE-family HTH domain
MNQEKIGKFIADCRKSKKLTQLELAEKLGVSDKSVSKWETGKCMPDLSLFKPLCEELNITINELLSGEKLDKKDYQNKLEENIVNIVDYNDKKSDVFGYIIFSFIGILSMIIGISFHSTNFIFPLLFELFGIFLILFALNKLIVNVKVITRIIFIAFLFILLFCIIEIVDIGSVSDVKPKLFYSKKVVGDCIIYKKIYNKNIIYKNNEYYAQGENDIINEYCR